MNLAYKFPSVFWNAANLIIDSGSMFFVSEEEDYEDIEVDEDGNIVEDEEDSEEVTNNKIKYGRIAKAIGSMQSRGVMVKPPSINNSRYTFTPDVKNNSVLFGLKGITKVGENIVEEIISKRPFSSIEDMTSKVKMNKTQVVNLIKSGALDDFGTREEVMMNYIDKISDKKNRLNLQNANMLINQQLLPKELYFESRVYRYNKYLRKTKDNGYLFFDQPSFDFYQENFDMDKIIFEAKDDYVASITETAWKSIYDSHMNKIRAYIKSNHDELLEKLNNNLKQEMVNKYATGNRIKWSMDSVNFYQEGHELDNVDESKYGLVDFFDLPEEPEIDRTFTTKEGHEIKMYKLYRIAGTVIDRDKNKSEITLLTKRGVVVVKAYGIMPYYDKQISERLPSGKKKVLEKSWFTRGNKLIITGMKKNESTFFAKKYKSTPGHHFTLITDIDENGELTLQEERLEVSEQ